MLCCGLNCTPRVEFLTPSTSEVTLSDIGSLQM